MAANWAKKNFGKRIESDVFERVEALFIGYSVLSRIPTFIRISELQIDSFPGAKFQHAGNLVEKATLESEIPVLSFGINNRAQTCFMVTNKEIQRAYKILGTSAGPAARGTQVGPAARGTRAGLVASGTSAVTAASGTASAVTGASGTESAVTGASGTESAVTGASGTESAVTGASGTEIAVAATSGTESAVTAASGTESAVTAASGTEIAVAAASGTESAVTGASGTEIAVAATSGTESAVTAASGTESAVTAAVSRTMGAKVSVVNQTPYNWYFATQNRGYTYIGPHCTTSYEEARLIHRYIYIRYGNHSWKSFSYEFNTHKGDTSFILRETYDRSQIQLHCTSEGGTHYCPNYGKIEQDEKRRQQQEERRRLERLEREQRIQRELDRESESSRRKLSRATERLREKQSFRGREQHHERTQVLHQQIEDDAAAIERNEVFDVEEKFKDLLLKYQVTENKGCLLEIGTGEGKSCILAMFATILAIRGTKVDIVTSSPVLARRDQEEWEKFFEMFGVTSSVVPPRYSSSYSPEEQEQCLKDAYRQQIVYGTVGAFAADTLKQEFEKRTTRDTRQFELVIVDEVDYMTLDNGVQVTFLSHESSGFRHVEQVLSNIWAMISSCQPIEMLETGEVKWATRIQYFHKAATAAVMGLETSDNFSANEILSPGVTLGLYTHEDIEMIHQAESKVANEGDGNEDSMSKALSEVMKKLGVSQQCDLLRIFEEVLENSVVFKCYSLENKKATCIEAQEKQGDLKVEMLLLEGGLACEIISEKSLIDATVRTIKSSIKYSDNLQTAKESDKFIIIPVFLKSYVENQLPVFVENALKAVEMTCGREYMIDTSPAAERDVTNSQDRGKYNAVIPVDFKASGVLEKNKKWGNGLQQFLEFKHQLAISPISNVTNYMSNFHYFKRYVSGSGIFGVSGTLGGKADQDFLARHYKATSYIVPAHRQKRVVELPVIQVKDGNHKWIQTICETSWKVAERGQVVLVICEDVKTADELYKKIQDEGRFKAEQITLYTISEKHNIEREKFCAGRIIIATNLGGRGTDIKVDESVNKCGGLFVLLTHFPHNRRVEKQIFGRTSRKGNPGMVQMVLNSEHLAPAYQSQSVEIMRKLREDYEIKRIHDMESDELVEINLKENLFSTFCKLLKDFDGHYSGKEKLDPMQMQLENIPDCFKHHQPKFDYQPAINALKESWALWLTLHEDHINRHDDFGQLEADLIRTINETSGKLLRGECDNFYDHVKQAIARTDLHCREKSSSDYGAKSYWQKVANSDPHYRAVALYNQAYITINLGKGNYKADAMNLLEDAKKSVEVYISEVSNTMVSCNLSITESKAHNTDNNFQSQMEARMNIFKSWMTYIDNALNKLKELEKNKSDAITEECSVYTLSEEKNFIITNELRSLYDYGLGVVFEVKKKPSKESFKSAMKNMTSSTVLKQNFKFATKYAVQEIGKQSVLTAMNYAIDAALQEVFKKILQSSFENVVTSSVKQSSKLDQTLVEFVSSGIPKAALKKENFKIDQNYEKQVKETVGMLCEEVIPHLILDCTTAREVISKLSEVCEAAEELMNKAKLSGVYEMAKLALKVAEYSASLAQILGAIPTKEIIDQKFVPELLESISELQKEMTKYDQDGRHHLHDVQRLKEEILQTIAQNVSEQFISSCSEHITSLMTSKFKSHLSSAAGKAVDNIMHRHKTQRFFDDQREKHNKRSASHKEVEQISDEDKSNLMQYTEDMCKDNQPTTALDVYVLTKSNLLSGRGIELNVIDENGKQLTVERYPGTNKSAGDIKLRLTKSAKATHPSQADTQLYSGRFDIVQDDGRIVSVNSNDQNALYHAVAQATGSETKDLKKEEGAQEGALTEEPTQEGAQEGALTEEPTFDATEQSEK
ncbi:hypothetical protein ROHU_018069 [Labeo rohita]|uniref:Uncharacterized protein n=1 Tax=Labeo rohita TaxID=84645 RepID=A0A498NFA8_LABRO|nr:hypothetical protein ROHU_018069 [Labeo rohita]